MIGGIFLTLFLVFLNGFFVAAEFAIVKVRSSQIDVKLAEGDTMARLARHVTSHLDSYLSATQLGITLASLGLGWIGEGVVSQIIISIINFTGLNLSEDAAHALALPVAFALITILHIVFGELAPKSLAIRHPLQVTLSLSAPLRIFYYIFLPFIWLLNGFSNFILRLIGIRPINEQETHTEEEIRVILGESLEKGNIRHSEHELIENVFRFDENTVRKIMIPRTKVASFSISEHPQNIIREVIEEGYSRMPVYSENIDNIVGVLYSKDLFKHMHKSEIDLGSLLHKPYFIPESKKIGELLKDFQRKKMHMAIVIDEFGGTAGIVTLEDILEEIVGEIQDESDDEPVMVQAIGDNVWIAEGMCPIESLNAVLPEPLPFNSEYTTLSGLLFYYFRGTGIPQNEVAVTVGNYLLTVLSSTGTMVEKVKISLVKNNGD